MIQQLGTADNSTALDPDEILPTVREVSEAFESGTVSPEDSEFLQVLQNVDPTAVRADADVRSFLRYDVGRLTAGIVCIAIVYDENSPRSRTVELVTNQVLDDFAEELAPKAKTESIVRTDATGIEWRISIPNPDWHLDDAYLDVTRVQVVDQTILGTVVYGPAGDQPSPLSSARAYSSLMARRVQSGVEGP